MHRFFISNDRIDNGNIIIIGEDALHISKVLRLRKGDEIEACDGNENIYLCSILNVDKQTVTCKINSKWISSAEPSVKVHLFQGIPKSTKMDLIVQKCTEIGVSSITPVFTERVITRPDEARDISGRISRWRKISEEAAKQSNRGRIPSIQDPVKLEEALKLMSGYGAAVMPYENETRKGLKQVMQGKNNINSAAIFIGPEGGFSENEIAAAVKNGIIPVTLGPRILRTETAGFVSLALILFILNNMGGE